MFVHNKGVRVMMIDEQLESFARVRKRWNASLATAVELRCLSAHSQCDDEACLISPQAPIPTIRRR
jgi:hypothetical protein